MHGARPDPNGDHRNPGQHRREKRKPKHNGNAAFAGLPHFANGDHGQSPGQRAQQTKPQRQPLRIRGALFGPHHQQHAAKPDQHRKPAAPANLLTKNWNGKKGQKQRHGEAKRRHGHQRQMDISVKRPNHPHHAENHAQHMAARIAHAQRRKAAGADHHGQKRDQRKEIAEENHLCHRNACADGLGKSRRDGKARRRQNHQNDATAARTPGQGGILGLGIVFCHATGLAFLPPNQRQRQRFCSGAFWPSLSPSGNAQETHD